MAKFASPTWHLQITGSIFFVESFSKRRWHSLQLWHPNRLPLVYLAQKSEELLDWVIRFPSKMHTRAMPIVFAKKS